MVSSLASKYSFSVPRDSKGKVDFTFSPIRRDSKCPVDWAFSVPRDSTPEIDFRFFPVLPFCAIDCTFFSVPIASKSEVDFRFSHVSPCVTVIFPLIGSYVIINSGITVGKAENVLHFWHGQPFPVGVLPNPVAICTR